MKILNVSNNFNELFENAGELEYGYYNPSEDDYNTMSLNKPRQQKITLRMINRLKKMRRTKSLEKSLKRELLGAMYGIDQDSEE